MARKKSTSLITLSQGILDAMKDSVEIKGTDYTLEDGGVIAFKDSEGNQCKVKVSKIIGPRSKTNTIMDSLIQD